MLQNSARRLLEWLGNVILSVPVRIKVTGIIVLTVVILGVSLNYWVTTSLSDWLSYLLTDVRVDAAMRAGGRSVMLVTLLAAAGSLVMGALLTFLLVRPLLDLRDMARKVAQGQLDTRATVWSRDEIGEVAIAVNQMTDHLVTVQEDLARTNRRLMAINQVMLAAERETEIHDVLYTILQHLTSELELQTGWIYLRDPERDVFHLASWYQVPPEWEDTLLYQPPDVLCRCQQSLIENWPTDAVGIQVCERLQEWPNCPTPCRHITLPIEARGNEYGVVNLLCPPGFVLNEDDFDLLTAVGTQLSETVANAWLRLKLHEKELARQALLESVVTAQEEERNRLARELHDGAGQMLTTLLVRIKTLEKQVDSPEMQRNLETLLELTSETIEQVRDLSHRLRPAALEELGLPVALETLLREMTQGTGIVTRCHWELDESTPLAGGIDTIFYRIAQEGLTNVLRHAQASRIDVRLETTDQTITMTIEDDGRGFAPRRLTAVPGRRHLGLIGMRERASMAGGRLDVYAAPGEGTRLVVCLPLTPGPTT